MGLTDNVVFKMCEDYKGRIWFLTSNHKLCYYDKGSIFRYAYNDSILKYIPDMVAGIGILVDHEDGVHLGFKSGGFVHIDKKGRTLTQSYSETGSINFEHINDQVLTYVVSKNVANSSDIQDLTREFRFIPSWKHPEKYIRGSLKLDAYQHSLPQGLHAGGQKYFVSVQHRLTLWNKGKVVDEYAMNNSIIALDRCGDYLFTGQFNEGAHQFVEANNRFQLRANMLRGYSVSASQLDGYGNYWFTTLESGLFQTASLDVKRFSLSDEEPFITASLLDENYLYLGYQDGKIERIDLKTKESVSWKRELNGYQAIYALERTSQPGKVLVLTVRPYYYDFGKNEVEHLDVGRRLGGVKAYAWYNDLECFIGYGYCAIRRKGKEHEHVAVGFDGDCRMFFQDKAMIGSSNGLLCIDLDDPYSGLQELIPDEAIVGMSEYNNTAFIAAQNGIYTYDKGKIEKMYLPRQIRQIQAINCSYRGEIWLFCSLGLVRYNPKTRSCKILNKNYGLPSFGVGNIMVNKDYVYLQSRTGAWEIKKDVLKSNPVHLELSGVKVNDKSRDLTRYYDLDYQENQLEILFEIFGNANEFVQFRYQLVGEDKKAVTTDQNAVRYPSLNPGKYTFIVSGTNDGVNYTSPVVVHFTIHAPYWKTWWFILICVAVLLLVSIFSIRWRIRVLKAKNVLASQMLELKSKALRSQMNPHFTYNALNSIQSLILRSKEEEASQYLSEFSKLLRSAMEASIEDKISLKQELQIIERYVRLEQLRFKEKFSWSCTIDPDIDPEEITVPPMFIQPLVENAIKHGILKGHEGSGLIRVNILRGTDDQLEISILNSGAKLEKKMSPEDFGSGLTILHQRLKSIHPRNDLFFGHKLESEQYLTIVRLRLNPIYPNTYC